MADVFAIFGTIVMMGIAFPGMLITWWLLFPNMIERSRWRVAQTPWACFWLGIAGTFILSIPITILLALPFGPAKFFGAVGIFIALAFASLGAAGIAAQMGNHLSGLSRSELTEAGAFVRGAVAFELSAAFPVLGWFIVIPFGIIISMGAATFAILRWVPKSVDKPMMESVSDTDLIHDPQSA